MRLVMVEWRDSMGSSAWEHTDEREPNHVATVQSVGWLVTETDDCVEIAMNIAERGRIKEQISHIMAIPKECVTSITPIRTRRKNVDAS